MNDTTERLSPAEILALQRGDRVRLIDKKGRVAQGAITARYGRDRGDMTAVEVGGRAWLASQHSFYRVDPGDKREIVPPKYSPTAEELRDTIADLGTDVFNREHEQPVRLAKFHDIVYVILGYRPEAGLPGADFGGKSREGWTAQHLAVGQMKRLLDQMVEDGTLHYYRRPASLSKTADPDRRYIVAGTAHHGWVTTEAYDIAKDAADNHAEQLRRQKLRETARQTVADAHPDEVEAQYQLLLAR